MLDGTTSSVWEWSVIVKSYQKDNKAAVKLVLIDNYWWNVHLIATTVNAATKGSRYAKNILHDFIYWHFLTLKISKYIYTFFIFRILKMLLLKCSRPFTKELAWGPLLISRLRLLSWNMWAKCWVKVNSTNVPKSIQKMMPNTFILWRFHQSILLMHHAKEIPQDLLTIAAIQTQKLKR